MEKRYEFNNGTSEGQMKQQRKEQGHHLSHWRPAGPGRGPSRDEAAATPYGTGKWDLSPNLSAFASD